MTRTALRAVGLVFSHPRNGAIKSASQDHGEPTNLSVQ